MQALTPQLFVDIFLAIAALMGATVVFRKVAPYLWGRRREDPIYVHIERTAREQAEKKSLQQNLNMTPKKAFRLRLTNVVILMSLSLVVTYLTPRISHEATSNTILSFAAYVIVGLIACSFFKVVPPALLMGLNWSNRITVRLYYVWLWPLNVFKAVRRTH